MIVGKLFLQEGVRGDTWREQFLINDTDDFGVDLREYDKIEMIIRKDLNPNSPLLVQTETPIIEGDDSNQMTFVIPKEVTEDWKPGRYWRDIRFYRDNEVHTQLRGEINILNNL